VGGLLTLFFRGLYRRFTGRTLPFPFLIVLWIVAYSSIGGINSILSLFSGFYKIRGTSRYAIAVASISLLYFAFFMDRWTFRWKRIPRLALFSLLVTVGLGDQLGKPYSNSRRYFSPESIAPFTKSDQALVRKIEGILPVDSMIFMLPVNPYPEYWTGIQALDSYETFRPYFYSTQLRYSFGSHKGRQGADWQLDVQELPAGEMTRALESYGFAGILLNRRGYEDRGDQLLAELAHAGWSMEFEQGGDNEWVFIRLDSCRGA